MFSRFLRNFSILIYLSIPLAAIVYFFGTEKITFAELFQYYFLDWLGSIVGLAIVFSIIGKIVSKNMHSMFGKKHTGAYDEPEKEL